jgi:hypothetical protein
MVAQSSTTSDPAASATAHSPSGAPSNVHCPLSTVHRSSTQDSGSRTQDLPPLSDRDSHLLAAFLIYRFDLATLADREKLHPSQLLAFTQSPAVAAHLAAYRKFADEAFHLRSLESRTNAINLLEDLAKKSTDPIEKRRCASAIIRGLSIPITCTFKPSTFLHPPHRPNQSHPHTSLSEPGRPRPGSDHPVHPTPDENAPTHPLRQEPTSNATTRASQGPLEFHEPPNPQDAPASFRTERPKPSAHPPTPNPQTTESSNTPAAPQPREPHTPAQSHLSHKSHVPHPTHPPDGLTSTNTTTPSRGAAPVHCQGRKPLEHQQPTPQAPAGRHSSRADGNLNNNPSCRPPSSLDNSRPLDSS